MPCKPRLKKTGAERRAARLARKAQRTAENRHQGKVSPVDPTEGMVEQFPSAYGEDLPEAVQGVARVLSRGLPDGT
jgi:hypothetical protein